MKDENGGDQRHRQNGRKHYKMMQIRSIHMEKLFSDVKIILEHYKEENN